MQENIEIKNNKKDSKNPRKSSGHETPPQIHSNPSLQKIAISIRIPQSDTNKDNTMQHQ